MQAYSMEERERERETTFIFLFLFLSFLLRNRKVGYALKSLEHGVPRPRCVCESENLHEVTNGRFVRATSLCEIHWRRN